MSKPVSNLRLFVAAYPPVEVARAMLRTLERLSLPRHRVVPADHVHLTLQFVGDVPARDLESVQESVERSASGLGSFLLTPRRLVSLPLRGRARLIAAETDSPATLLELQRRLAHRLARKSRADPGDRFLPHITLCRFSNDAAGESVDQVIDAPSFRVDSIRLMRSVLRPDGAEHHMVSAAPLTSDH